MTWTQLGLTWGCADMLLGVKMGKQEIHALNVQSVTLGA